MVEALNTLGSRKGDDQEPIQLNKSERNVDNLDGIKIKTAIAKSQEDSSPESILNKMNKSHRQTKWTNTDN